MPTLPKPLQPIRLHTTLLSGHGHRAKLFLTLLDLPFTTIELNMKAGDNRKPAHLALNPFGEVPVIEDGNIVVTDSNAILVYLARKYGDASWLPDDPVGAVAVQRWLSLAAGKIAYGPCATRLVTVFGAPKDYETAKKMAEDLFAVIDPEFRDKPFAVGQTPTIADIAAYSYIAHAPEGGISLEPYPHLRAWLKRVEALPRFVPMPGDQGRLARRGHVRVLAAHAPVLYREHHVCSCTRSCRCAAFGLACCMPVNSPRKNVRGCASG